MAVQDPLEEFEREYRKHIGVEYDLNNDRIIFQASRDTIVNFAEAVGDNNPLWTNEEYAAKSRFGDITGPPPFLYAITHGSRPAMGPPEGSHIEGLTLLYAGAELELYKPVRRGDTFTVTAMSTGLDRRESKNLGALLFTTGETRYRNQDGEIVGVLRPTICHYRTPQGQAVSIDREPRPEVEAKSPDLLAFERERRGAEPRYWEDVRVGEEMTPVLEKGLLTMMEIVRFSILAPPLPRRIEQKRTVMDIGFSREESQKRAGLEDASDYGPQRVCWLSQMATDWMGDDGTLKKLTCQIRHPNLIGDVNTVKGRVTEKYIENGEHLVVCEMGVENQAGVVTAPGRAVIALPSKDKNG